MDRDRNVAGLHNAGEPQWVKVKPEWVERELARRSCLDMLMTRFGLDAALVSVPQLGKVLGMSKSTIYASVKAGKFFIPSRLLGASPMFTIDDVVTWYLPGQSGPEPMPVAGSGHSRAAGGRAERDDRGKDLEIFEAQDKRRRDRAVDDLVARALKSMGQRKGADG